MSRKLPKTALLSWATILQAERQISSKTRRHEVVSILEAVDGSGGERTAHIEESHIVQQR